MSIFYPGMSAIPLIPDGALLTPITTMSDISSTPGSLATSNVPLTPVEQASGGSQQLIDDLNLRDVLRARRALNAWNEVLL